MAESSFRQVPLQPLAKLPVVSSQEVAGFFDASTRLEEEAQKKFENDVEAEATRQGIVDGQQGKLNTELLYAPTFRGKAYTRAAQLSFLQTVELNATQKIQAIILQNPTDTGKAKNEITGYLNGVVQGFPPALKERLGQTFLLKSQIKANIGLSKILNRERRALANKQEVDALARDNARSIEIVGNAENILDSDPNIALKSVAAIVEARSQIISDYGAMIVDEEGREIAAFNPAFRERALQQFDIDTSNAAIKSAFNQSQNKDEYLRQFKANEMDLVVKDEQGRTVLDLRPNVRRKAALVNYMRAEISRENVKRDAAIRLNRRDLKAVKDTLKVGGNVTEETIAILKARSHQLGDDESFNEVADWVSHSNDMHMMSVMKPANLDGVVNAERAEIENLRDAGKSISKTDIEQLEAKEALLDNMSRELNQNPLDWGNTVGLIELTPIIPTAQETIEVAGQQINPQDLMDKRIADAEEIGKYYGRPPRFLTDEEQTNFSKFLTDRNTSPDAKLSLLASLSGFGDRQDEVLAEISTKSPEYMHIAGLMRQGSSPSVLADAVEGLGIIQGTGNIKGQRVMQVNSSEVAEATDGVLGVTYQQSPQTRKGVVAVAEGIYTARMFRKGHTDTTDFDEDEWVTALQEASGANFVDGVQFGGITTFNDRQVHTPNWIKADDFEDFIKALTDKDWQDGGLGGPPIFPKPNAEADPVLMTKEIDVFSDLNLISVGDGQYIVARNTPDQDPKFYMADVDPTHPMGAVRQGFYVLDLNRIPSGQRTQAFQRAKTFFEVDPSLKRALEEDVGKAVESVKERVGEAVETIKQTAPELVEKGKETVSELVDQAREAFRKAKELAEEFFKEKPPQKVERLIRETEKKAKQLQKDRSEFFKLPVKKQTATAERKLSERTLTLKKKTDEIKALIRKEAN